MVQQNAWIQSTFMAPAQLSPLETRFLLAGGGSGGWPRSSRSSSRLSRLPRSPCPEIGFSLSVSDFSALSREQTRNLKWIPTWFTIQPKKEWSENIRGNLALGCRQPCTQVFVQVFYQRTLAKMELAMMAWYRLESKLKIVDLTILSASVGSSWGESSGSQLCGAVLWEQPQVWWFLLSKQ